MKHRLLFFVLFFIISVALHATAQTEKTKAQSKCDCYDRLLNLSNYYSRVNDLPMAISALKDAVSFLDSNWAGADNFQIAEYYSYTPDTDSAVLYYLKAAKYGFSIRSVKDDYPGIYKRLDTNMIRQYEYRNRQKMDLSMYTKMVEVLAIHQSIRDGVLVSEEDLKSPTGTYKKQFIDTLFHRSDQNAFSFVKWILDNYGFPNDSMNVSLPGFNAFLLHVTDVDNDNSRYIFDKLESLSGECRFPFRSRILFLKDRQHYYKDHRTYGGVFETRDQYLAIEHLDKVDSIRFMYDQVRLKESISIGDTLPPDYKARPYPENYFCLKKYKIE